jgi:Ca-activated chloride channel family protein
MKRIRYSKYVPDPAGDMSMEDLLSALSDYLLQSGFNDNFWYELPEGEQTLDELRSKCRWTANSKISSRS